VTYSVGRGDKPTAEYKNFQGHLLGTFLGSLLEQLATNKSSLKSTFE